MSKHRRQLDEFFGIGAEAEVRAAAMDAKKIVEAAEKQDLPPGISCSKAEIGDVMLALTSVLRPGQGGPLDVSIAIDLKACVEKPDGQPIFRISVPGMDAAQIEEAKRRKDRHDDIMSAAEVFKITAKRILTHGVSAGKRPLRRCPSRRKEGR